MTNKIHIRKGTIKCKYCNKDYPDVLAAYSCNCNKKAKWGNPAYLRKTIKIHVRKKLQWNKEEDIYIQKLKGI